MRLSHFQRRLARVAVLQTHQLIINSKQYQANIQLRKTELNKATDDYKRRQVLGSVNAIGREELQHAQDAVESAKAALDVAVQQYNANQALILNTPLEKQPAIQQAAAQVRDAWLALERTQIRSPITGYVSRRSVQVGAQITPSTPLMAVVPDNQLWIDASPHIQADDFTFINYVVTVHVTHDGSRLAKHLADGGCS